MSVLPSDPAALAAPISRRASRRARSDFVVLGLVVLAHLGVFALLAARASAVPAPPTPLTVEIITAAAAPVTPAAPLAPAPRALAKETKPVDAKPKPRAPEPAPRRPAAARASDVAVPATSPAPAALAAAAPTSSTSSQSSTTASAEGDSRPQPTSSAAPAAAVAKAPVETPARFAADYLKNPAPAYPAVSRRLGEEGKVVLRVLVTPDGRPGQIELASGSGSHRLDQAAQDAVGRWKFVPARRGDEAVAAWVLVPIVFSLGA